jgi:hypothetical protein
MKRAALGFKMHSGWGVVVAVAGDAGSMEVIHRGRIDVIDPGVPGTSQPYHYAARLKLPEAERHVANCATDSQRLALTALEHLRGELENRDYQIVGAAMLLASGRPLPSFDKILAAHPLIHTAEGEFFRTAVSESCERLKIPITAIRERDIEERAKALFHRATGRIQRAISDIASSIGPPWTKDHKSAALAALIALQA